MREGRNSLADGLCSLTVQKLIICVYAFEVNGILMVKEHCNQVCMPLCSHKDCICTVAYPMKYRYMYLLVLSVGILG